MRTIARETLFKVLFSSQFSEKIDNNVKKSLFTVAKLDENDLAYCETVLNHLKTNKEAIAKQIDEHSYSFPEQRLYPADKSILQIALVEILYMDDIPDKVSINEAANLASKYSSERSASFVSGILSTIVKIKEQA